MREEKRKRGGYSICLVNSYVYHETGTLQLRFLLNLFWGRILRLSRISVLLLNKDLIVGNFYVLNSCPNELAWNVAYSVSIWFHVKFKCSIRLAILFFFSCFLIIVITLVVLPWLNWRVTETEPEKVIGKFLDTWVTDGPRRCFKARSHLHRINILSYFLYFRYSIKDRLRKKKLKNSIPMYLYSYSQRLEFNGTRGRLIFFSNNWILDGR